MQVQKRRIPRNSFTAWRPIPPAAPVMKTWSPSRPRKDMMRVSCEARPTLLLGLRRWSAKWKMENEQIEEQNRDASCVMQLTPLIGGCRLTLTCSPIKNDDGEMGTTTRSRALFANFWRHTATIWSRSLLSARESQRFRISCLVTKARDWDQSLSFFGCLCRSLAG